MHKYTFTIIIPHKNIPTLLQRCIDSIPKREDLHIIIVDDNSDPRKVDFESFPGLSDPRCEVIFTKEGRGAGYARNVALAKTDSKWVLFADADDYYSEELNGFLDKYKDIDADLVFFENKTVNCETGELIEKDLMVKDFASISNKENNFEPLRYMTHAPWTKMIRMSLVQKYNITFQEIIAANDVWFSTQVGHYAHTLVVSDYKIYIRTIRNGSLFYSFKKENLLARLEAGYKVNAFLKRINKLNYHVETWGYFLNLRKISWSLFLRTLPKYIYKTPKSVLIPHVKYLLLKK